MNSDSTSLKISVSKSPAQPTTPARVRVVAADGALRRMRLEISDQFRRSRGDQVNLDHFPQ